MIRYKKLGYVAFNVSDVERSAPFYNQGIGLDLLKRSAGEPAFLSATADHHCVVLYQAPQPGLKRVAFELEDARQLDEACATLTRGGISWHEVQPAERAQLAIGQAIRFVDLNGLQLEFYVGMTQRSGVVGRYHSEILRLGHAVFLVPNFEATFKFYTELLNFQLSDYRVRTKTGATYSAFFRCYPSPYHHSMVIVEANKLQFQHTAFMVGSLDGLMRGRNSFIRQKVPVGTPGRHLASGSVFQYFSDPDGLTLEYTLGMEEFSVDAPRPARRLDDSPLTSDIWGGEGIYDLQHLGTVEMGSTPSPLRAAE